MNPIQQQSQVSKQDIERSIPDLSQSVIVDQNNKPLPTQNDQIPLNQQSEPTNINKSCSRKLILVIIILAVLGWWVWYFKVRIDRNSKQEKSEEGVIQFNTSLGLRYFWINQKLDHFSEGSPEWKQRCFINLRQNFNKQTPIFLYIPSFGPVNTIQKSTFLNNLADKRNALSISIEHRYFGESLPFNAQSHKLQNLKYLTIDQIVEDVAYIIKKIKNTKLFQITDQNPWIINGPQISGTICAWIRAKYPSLTIGAISSSPVIPTVLVPLINVGFYSQVGSGGSKCRKALDKVFTQFRKDLYSSKQTMMISNYGQGVNITAEQLIYLMQNKFRQIDRQFYYYMGVQKEQSQIESDFQSIMKIQSSKYDPIKYSSASMNNQRQWKRFEVVRTARSQWYLKCNQLGLFQVTDQTIQKSFHSKTSNQTFFKNMCKSIFNKDIWPVANQLNDKYSQDMQTVQNLMVVHGYYDIWLPYGMKANNQSDIDVQIVKCGSCVSVPDYDQTVLSINIKQKNIIWQAEEKIIDKWLEEYFNWQKLIP